MGDAELLRRLLSEVDAVSHQAAMVGHGVDPADAPAYADQQPGGGEGTASGDRRRRWADSPVIGTGATLGAGSDRHRPQRPAVTNW